MPTRRTVRWMPAALTAVVLVVPITTAAASHAAVQNPAAQKQTTAVPKIAWGGCGADPKLAAFQCAQVEVPTDYDSPHGPTTTIALTRLPAGDPIKRIGTLFTNPGGPGGSGVDFVQQAAQVVYTPELRARFDILGFDPRGVARSDSATCFPTAKQEVDFFATQPPFPLGRTEEKRFTVDNAKLGASCLTTSPDRLAHDSTANVARDMDLLRQAVGDDKLSYAGYSYGTYLGATYARLFPGNVRALMLDGTLNPVWYSGSDGDPRPVGVRIRQGDGASDTLSQFNLQCKTAGASRCALAKLGDPATVVERLYQRLKTNPVDLPLPDGTMLKVTYPVAVQLTFFSLYSPAAWPDLASLLADLSTAANGKASAAGKRTAKVDAPLPDGLLEWTRRKEDYVSVGNALTPCIETRQTGRPLSYPQYAAAADAKAPHFGRARAWVGQTCEFLPIRDTDAFLGPWKLDVPVPVLVFGTKYDPATPYQATRPYADMFPDARMMTLNGWGHTTIGKSRCADKAITAYLVDLTAPADGEVCQPDRKPFDPLPNAETSAPQVRIDLPPGVQHWQGLGL
ncbi:MAG: hypothetical protein QOG10_3365 [Kribbellaceae bacterium]|nr:hypothetical protein [Kribbellaceae bacterium]